MTCDESCPAKLWCGVTFGKDSQTAADELDRQGRLAGVFLIQTGISIDFLPALVREYWEARGHEVLAIPTPTDYDEWVAKYGFPGPAQHKAIMSALKGRAIRLFKKLRPGAEIASGARSGESERRWRHTSNHSTWEGVRMHTPISDWSTAQVWSHVKEHKLPLSPAYQTLHISGECLCGSFAQPEEVYIIETFYPKVAKRLHALEERVVRESRIRNPRSRRWGGGKRGVGFRSARKQTNLEQVFCGSCQADWQRAASQNP